MADSYEFLKAHSDRIRAAQIVENYASAARVISLHLREFCDDALPYDEMIAEAARRAAEQLAFFRTRDTHADEVIRCRNQRLSEIAVESDRLRAALVGIVGVDGREELEAMEGVMRLLPGPAADKAATIDAIHALLSTLPNGTQASDAVPE